MTVWLFCTIISTIYIYIYIHHVSQHPRHDPEFHTVVHVAGDYPETSLFCPSYELDPLVRWFWPSRRSCTKSSSCKVWVALMRRLFFCSESFTVSLLSLRSCFSWRGRAQSFCGKPEGRKGDGEEVLKILQKNSLAAFPLRALLFLLDMVLHTPSVGPDYA